MKRNLFLFLMLIPLALSPSLRADQLSFQGNFPADDYVKTFDFSLAAPGVVTLQTFSYAGGTNGAGSTITAGGFDPVLTLFDGMGNFVISNNDGPCGTVGKDATTLNCFDAYLSLSLEAGAYTVALTENDNLAVGPTLADSFTQVGNGNFTCPEFMGSPGAFCDASPSQRNSAWALDVVTPDTSPDTSPVPEPASGVLLLSGIGLFFVLRTYSENWR